MVKGAQKQKKPLEGLSLTTAFRIEMLGGAETSRGANPQKLPDSKPPLQRAERIKEARPLALIKGEPHK